MPRVTSLSSRPQSEKALTPFQEHVREWRSCQRCPLCDGRTTVVLARGQIPCDVLFVGEAPGVSEDVDGHPFVGPAGQFLDGIILEAERSCRPDFESWDDPKSLRKSFTNLVACIPKGDDGEKVKEPPKESIDACRPRLREFVKICRPRLIVEVGKLVHRFAHDLSDRADSVEIMHPAAILRAEVSARGLLRQRCVVTLSDAFSELLDFS